MLLNFFSKKKIDRQELFKLGALAGLLEIIYIVLVAGFMILAQSLFPNDSADAIIGITSFLIIFVFSAGISGVLIFGLPFYFAVQNKYQEALIILASSAVAMIAILIIIILGQMIIN